AKIHHAMRKQPYQANRMLGVISSLYAFAGRRQLNPARDIKKYPERGRERFLSLEELSRLGEAIREAETTGVPYKPHESDRLTVIGPHAAAALRLLLFTGARLREILDLRWEYVDFDRGLLLLPDSKTGKKAIVLNAPALDVLANLSRVGP